MNIRNLIRAGTATALAVAFAAPALAQDHSMPMPPHHPGPMSEPMAAPGPWGPPRAPQSYNVDPQMRANWLAECHRRMGGDRWGRDDDRQRDRNRDRDRHHDRDRPSDDGCESYFDGYYAHHNAAAQAGYGGYGYAQGCCQAAPMMMAPQRAPECRETVEYEYVDGPARRLVPPRPRPQYRRVPDKRIRVVPDKRVRVY